MERLTHARCNGIKTGYWSPKNKEVLAQRLAEYENTGLEPEEIERLNDFEKSQVGIMLKKLNEEQRKHRWIPVEERLPEKEYDIVLWVTDKNHYFVAVHNKEYGFRTGDVYVEGKVIAWMPLPYHTERIEP